MRNSVRNIAACTALLTLAACGGSGGGGGGRNNNPVVNYTVSATATAGGSISPMNRTVASGGTTSFTVTPDAGFGVGTVTGCSGTLTGNTFTTGAITADCTVNATFGALPAAAAVPTFTAAPIKTFNFAWADVGDATFYRLLENPDNSSGFVQVGPDVAQGTGTIDIVVPMFARLNATYILQSCNDFGCTDSSVVAVSGPLVDAIGYIKASNAEEGELYGWSVALSGDGNTLAVGTEGEDSTATGIDGDQNDNSAEFAGAVYVYSRNGTGWVQEAYIKASNTGAGDGFGHSVVLSHDGNTLALGARGEDSNATGINGDGSNDLAANAAGAVYVFTRANGTWAQEAYVKASNTGRVDRFGDSVALSASGNTLAVGASAEDSNATGVDGDQNNEFAQESGAVYVYERVGGNWSQQAYLKASNTATDDEFGASVSLSDDGNTLAVGAYFEDSNATGINGDESNNFLPSAGAVYVFVRSNDAWSQQAYDKASNTDAGDQFGYAVSLSGDGDTLAVGARIEASNAAGIDGNADDNSANAAGAVYVYTRSSMEWSQQAYVKASNPGAFYRFGVSVSLSADGNTLAVGASGEGSNAPGLNGNQTDTSLLSAGAAYVFVRNGISWSQVAYVKASNPDAQDWFGESVSLSRDGTALAVGAFEERSNATGINGDQSDNSAISSGAAYVY